MFLEISQNSQENSCARDSFLRSLCHSCFPVNFAKFLRTPPDDCFWKNLKQRLIQNPVKHLNWSFFPKIVNGFQPLTIFAKNFFLVIWLGSEYTCLYPKKYQFWRYSENSSRIYACKNSGRLTQDSLDKKRHLPVKSLRKFVK